VGSICVVEREDGRVLLIQHSYRKRWGIPGGLLNRGEAGTAAAVREVREEVGLAIELIGEPVVVVDPEPRRVDLIFRARPAPGADPDAARPSSPEIVRAEWHLVTELPDLQHETAMAFEALARAGLHPLSPPRSG
jgi:8-oxo-dGTP pyrophosphatase MutT (NUDIX family)